MPSYREPTSEELEASRDPRVQRRQLDALETSLNYLEHAAHLRKAGGLPEDPELRKQIERGRDECRKLKSQLSGRVESRRRPKNRAAFQSCIVYLDECGQHLVRVPDGNFPVFVLSAVIVKDEDKATVDAAWKGWKRELLGSAGVIVHEPDVRNCRGDFRDEKGQKAIEALPAILEELEFRAVTVAVHTGDYHEKHGGGQLDNSLPAHTYLMALDFLLERVLFALDTHYGGAGARLIAESRGYKEDAQLQYEFARLHLEGTTYVPSTWFRQQLNPGIQFMTKKDNNTGLQLADLIARPIAEKVLDPSGTPDRWEVVRAKLCDGKETKNSSIGLKVLPWKDAYGDL